MKLVTFEVNSSPHRRGGSRYHIGHVIDNTIIDLTAYAPDMQTVIEKGVDNIPTNSPTNERYALDDVHLLAPIPKPVRNIMCLGKNYADHAKESQEAWGEEVVLPKFPVIFTKATTAVNGPYDDVEYDTAVSTHIDWEAELAVIIGKAGKNIPVEEAMDYVFGYTVLNDMTARDLQRQGKQFFKGKSLDGHCPMGPWIVTADSFTPAAQRIVCRVNGVTKQESSLNRMIFDIPASIAYLSRGMTLLPGDIIATGTPAGVGFARTPPEFLRPGDLVECEVEGIGIIRNQIA